LIAAHAKGLEAVWLGVYPLKERITGMRRLLAIPDRILPLSVVAIGYPEERASKEDRYQPSRVHTNRW
jgi:nitroreductase